MSPLMNVARMIFHDVVHSSDTPALTPAFPIAAPTAGIRGKPLDAIECPRGFDNR